MLLDRISIYNWALLTILFITEFVRGAFYLSFLTLYAVKSLGLSLTVAGFATSVHYFMETVSKTAAGWQFDRLGWRVLRAGLFTCLFSLLVMKWWPQPLVLIVFSALFGLGVSPIWLGVMSEVAPVDLPTRSQRIGMVFAAWLAGGGAGLVTINFLLQWGYELAFTVIISLWLISLGLAWLIPGAERRRKPLNDQGFLFALRRLTINPAVTRILLPGMFLQTLAAGLLLPILPLFAQNQLGLTHNQYGFLLLSGGGAAVLSLIPMGMLVGRMPLKTPLALGFGLSALSLALFSTSHGPAAAFPLAVLLGLSYAAVLPAWNTLLARIIPPERQATGWGVFATVEGFGAALGPALGSLVARAGGITAPLVLATVVLLSVAVFYTFYPLEKFFVK
ncbi:MFS transporter [Desulfofundulus thermobenzoicus]|uniref:MFS transporter n=1 Tax=Desulfofundulus thermobenzoicus TaxID=29376 RepID=A0A6N7IS42_9FIRM|nr:MFS transporter [Desulfofundulus thermobenzoicus]MQL52329.1 MFS transporter [Desulfofundulus thermobenzoicus]